MSTDNSTPAKKHAMKQPAKHSTHGTGAGAAPGTGKLHAVLLQPPPGDLTGPYPALAYLKASASRAGLSVAVRDLGIEALGFLAKEGHVRGLLYRAEDLRIRLEAEHSLSAADLRRYALLVSAIGLGLKPGLVGGAMAALKDKARFYDYRGYKRACRLLEAFYRLLSAVHFPTVVSPSEYPTIREMQSFEDIMAHRDRSLNPYVEYYEDVLFPEIAEAKPAVVGISMVFGSQSVQALALAKLLKERFPEIHIVMGGAYLSQWVLLLNDDRLADLFTCTDSIVCGEGERAFTELLTRVAYDQPLEGMPNLIHRDRLTSAIHRFNTLEYTDLADLPPPDFSDLDMESYLSPELIIPYCISRGCYWGRCAFCQNRYGDNRMRRYQAVPVEKAIEEMSQLADKYGTNHFNFSNDALDPGYLKRFCKALAGSGKKLVWNTDLRAEKSFTPERCREMARAGLNCVAIGFESGCQKTLDAIDKGYQVETLRQVMKSFHDAGVATQAMGIFGFPGETHKDGELTVRFLEENVDRISYYVMGLLMVLPGSRLYGDPRKYGITSVAYENNPLMAPEPVWRSDIRMSARAVNDLYDRLSRLEEIYAINDYPYVGGLSTNHGFLYFRLGPDILKRLKAEESQRYLRLQRILGATSAVSMTSTVSTTATATAGVTDAPLPAKKLKSVVPHLNLPFTLYSPRFPVEQAAAGMDRGATPEHRSFPSTVKQSYLIDPVNMPVPVTPALAKLLQRVDGQRSLKAILARLPDVPDRQLVPFIMYLVSQDVLDVPGV